LGFSSTEAWQVQPIFLNSKEAQKLMMSVDVEAWSENKSKGIFYWRELKFFINIF